MNNINELKNIIRTIGPTSCPYEINLHCHSLYSDGSLSPVQIIDQAVNLNLKHFDKQFPI